MKYRFAKPVVKDPSKIVYVVTSLFSGKETVISEDNLNAKVSSTYEKAYNYMGSLAIKLYGNKQDHDEKTYYNNEHADYVDFGDNSQEYRTSHENWGFFKLTREEIDHPDEDTAADNQ